MVVTPCVGVWIEIDVQTTIQGINNVTPCVGVWIEISQLACTARSRAVTPCVGVWIEIVPILAPVVNGSRHSLRGSVD